MYTQQELDALTKPQLKTIIGLIPGNIATTGNKPDLVLRIMEKLDDIPADHVKLVGGNVQNANAAPQPLPAGDPLNSDNPIANLIAHFKLCDRTVDFFQEEHITVIKDVLLFEEMEITAWNIPARDRKTIRNFAYPLPVEADQPVPVTLPPRPVLLPSMPAIPHRGRQLEEDTRSIQTMPPPPHRPKKHRSHSSSSSSGESTVSESYDSSASESDRELPLHARNLPRPHKFMAARLNNKGKERKPKALEIDMPEFLTESARLVRQLTDLPSHRETAREYSAYVEYINQRNCDYTAVAVLRFDDDFRRRAKQLKLSLSEGDLRRSLSEKYFHAATRKSKSTGNYSSDGNYSFRAGQRYTPPNNSARQVCMQFNAGNCTYGTECRYLHKCKQCNAPSHGAAFCYQRVQQNNQPPNFAPAAYPIQHFNGRR